MTQFTGRKVFITGATGVYGREFAMAFAKAGAELFLSDLPQDSLTALAEELAPVANVTPHAADLRQEGEVDGLVGAVIDAWHSPEIVINNAAIFPFGGLLDAVPAEWDAVMDINLKAPFMIMRGFGRAMIERSVRGCFVNIGSSAGHLLRGNGVAYCVSKRALEWLTQGFALEFGPYAIRANLIEPGFRPGSELADIPDDYAKAIVKGIPMRREVEAGEVAAAVMFLCSDQASYITGTSLAANGGDSITRRASQKP